MSHSEDHSESLFSDLASRLHLAGLPNDFLRINQTPMPSAADPSSSFMPVEQSPALVYQASPTYVGQLKVSFVEARLNKNYGLIKMNPYVRCRIGQNVFETPSVSGGGRTPRWDKTVICFLQRGVSRVLVDVLDEGMFADTQIANVAINIPEAVINGETVDNWYPLSGKLGENNEGEINVIISLVPLKPAAKLDIDPAVLPTISDEDIKELRALCPPQISDQLIRSVLIGFGGDKDQAASALIEMLESLKATTTEPTSKPDKDTH